MSQKTSAERFRRVLRYALPEWPMLTGIVALTLAFSALTALQPWPLKILVDYGLGSGAPPPSVSAWFEPGALASPVTFIVAAAIASLAVFAATAALNFSLTLAWAVVGQRMVYAVATELFERLQRLSLIFHARRSVGDSLSRITGDAWSVYSVVNGVLVAPARDLLIIVCIGVVSWQLDRKLTLTMLAVVPLLLASSHYFGSYLKSAALGNREATARLTSFLHQVLGAIPVVQVFSAEARNERQFATLARDVVTTARRAVLLNQSYTMVNGVTTTVGFAVVLYVGGQSVLAQQMSIGTLLVFIAYMRSLESAARGLLATYGAMRSAEASIDRICEILDSEEAVQQPSKAYTLPPRDRQPCGRLTFECVTFGYEPGRPVLADLNLEIHPGETLALVGSSGAGKTTLASLVPRFFDPWEGRVTLDGLDVKALRLDELRSEVALVLQDAFILPLSVAENIAYGRPGATREEIVAAAVAANAHEFISELSLGYDTVLGEHGSTLSGGQQQRIAIARALLKDSRILILDEPTAALDTTVEELVMEALERLMSGRTTIIIAHRLSTLRRAHRIAVLDNGHIVELGTHAELVAAAGRYAHLHALHAVSRRDLLI